MGLRRQEESVKERAVAVGSGGFTGEERGRGKAAACRRGRGEEEEGRGVWCSVKRGREQWCWLWSFPVEEFDRRRGKETGVRIGGGAAGGGGREERREGGA
ncbi:hypothetical protein HAX54_015886, partial [Datura stramonium]|nr:hypothetical protein [Datura stramonium]